MAAIAPTPPPASELRRRIADHRGESLAEREPIGWPARLGLIVLMALGSLSLWIGTPTGWLWIGSQLTDSQQGSMLPYGVVCIGMLASALGIGRGLVALDQLYDRLTGVAVVRIALPWHRSLRDNRERHLRLSVLATVMVVSVLVALIAFETWFLFFAGPSIPGGPGPAGGR